MQEEIAEVGTGIDTPVVFITYIRLDTTRQTFERIRRAKPQKLYYISDAGKDENGQKRVEEVRRYVEAHIDWPCELHKNYADKNMGAGKRIQSGLNWVFETEDRAIIIEDDVLVSMSFFRFAQEMLERYATDERIHAVTSNRRQPQFPFSESYSFSRYSSIWGWATWRRAWCGHDMEAENWPQIRKSKFLRKEYGIGTALTYEREIESVYRHENDAWDIQWFLARALSHSLEVVPCVPLATNIGNVMSEDATHPPIPVEDAVATEMEFPLVHPNEVQVNTAFDEEIDHKQFPIGFVEKTIRLTVPAAWLRGVRVFFERFRRK